MTVEKIFDLGNRLVLGPGVNGSETGYLRPKTVVELVCPDGSSFTTNIVGIELVIPNHRGKYPIALSKEIGKGNIPIGTQVWTVDDEP